MWRAGVTQKYLKRHQLVGITPKPVDVVVPGDHYLAVDVGFISYGYLVARLKRVQKRVLGFALKPHVRGYRDAIRAPVHVLRIWIDAGHVLLFYPPKVQVSRPFLRLKPIRLKNCIKID